MSYRLPLTRAALAVVLLFPATLVCAGDENKSYPAHVLIIRHAEKPPDDAPSPDLSAEGMARAEALPKLFKKTDGRPAPFPSPDFLFAAKDSGDSSRPGETIAPLAKALGLTVNSDFTKKDGAELAHELFRNPKYAGKTVLICWRHGKMPKLAGQLKAVGAPDPFDNAVFDRVWQIDYDKDGKATFTDLPQRLMPKDSEK